MHTFDFTNDPITAGQVEKLALLLGDQWSTKARDGFLVISGRFVDSIGADRTEELRELYKTQVQNGRVALRRSLEALFEAVGSLEKFERDFPIFINDPEKGSLGVFPQLPILGIQTLSARLFRTMDSKAKVHDTGEPLSAFIMREGKLPHISPFRSLILRKKPRIYWCSYEAYDTPLATRSALQILASWESDCKLRATLPTAELDGSAYVAFNGDTKYEDGTPGGFAGYFLELKAQDHPELPGGGLQIAVLGAPVVSLLEQWDDAESCWSTIWARPA